ncbi:fumarylacetoacetate hydrolase family protein [Undibacterium sp. Di26W]|uniref:fumarylacetoacetate hydrolase family protein n=1 Tax=Undibacterium sp. Di26W TaxID=3413035 RepID=UPI003BF25844
MRLITYAYEERMEIGALLSGDTGLVRLQAAYVEQHGMSSPHLVTMLSFLAGNTVAHEVALSAMEYGMKNSGPDLVLDLSTVKILAPVPTPESIREFMNFEQHVINATRKYGMKPWRAKLDLWIETTFGRQRTLAYTSNQPWYERPVYYKGNRFSVVGNDADIVIPSYTKVFDYELEFGIYLCKRGRDIDVETARSYIGGYTIFNDFSARDIQGREMGGRLGPAKGKDFDTGNCMGPVLVTPDEIPDPYALSMRARINGEEVSLGNSKDMYFTFEEVLAYVSKSETLYPGEFFGSGTCSGRQGMGCGLEHGRFLKAGDVIELEVEHIGILRNKIVAGV